MRLLIIMIGLLLCTLALAQPELQPAPPPPPNADMLVLVEIMKAADTAVTALAKDTLASKRLEEITGEGLIIAPFSLLAVEGDGDDFTKFVVSWTQEKMTNAMIKADEAGHFAVIDRAFIDKAIQELKLDAKALADPKNWPAIGQATGAKYMITGGIGIIPLREHPLSLSFSLTARIVSVEDGKAVAAGDAGFIYPEQNDKK
ncbi:MAG: hypothetical protein ACYDCO_13865 [Armatimonadota bacterium]